MRTSNKQQNVNNLMEINKYSHKVTQQRHESSE